LHWYDRLATERLEKKSDSIKQLLESTNNNWLETFYISFSRAFGFKTNALPFELLAKSLPYKIILKYKHDPLKIEALVFGQAGFFNTSYNDNYLNKIKIEYQYLQHLHELSPLDKHLWKFLRMRPMNFPTIRLAQYASVLCNSPDISKLVNRCTDYKYLLELLKQNINPYWETHYIPDKTSKKAEKKLSNKAAESIIINSIVPFIFLKSKLKQDKSLYENSLKTLSALDPETNTIINRFKKSGLEAYSANDSQALLELYNSYCKPKRCLYCSIGNTILKKSILKELDR